MAKIPLLLLPLSSAYGSDVDLAGAPEDGPPDGDELVDGCGGVDEKLHMRCFPDRMEGETETIGRDDDKARFLASA